MNTFYFNTGVLPQNCNGLTKGQVWRGGTKQIPFDCDAPQDAKLMYLCNNPNLDTAKYPNVIVREIFNTTMISKYAYFRVKN